MRKRALYDLIAEGYEREYDEIHTIEDTPVVVSPFAQPHFEGDEYESDDQLCPSCGYDVDVEDSEDSDISDDILSDISDKLDTLIDIITGDQEDDFDEEDDSEDDEIELEDDEVEIEEIEDDEDDDEEGADDVVYAAEI